MMNLNKLSGLSVGAGEVMCGEGTLASPASRIKND